MVRRFFWIFFVILDLLLIVLFLTGYLARYAHPAIFWWGELIAIGLPYLGLLLIAATLVVAFARRWGLLFVHGLLLILLIVRFMPSGGVITPAKAAADPLTILTFNAPDYWGGYDKESRKDRMEAFIRDVNPDLIALQEADIYYRSRSPAFEAQPYIRNLKETLGYDPPDPDQRKNIRSQQPVFSRIKILDYSKTTIGVTSEYQGGTEVVRVTFEWKGRPAMLYNVHLRSFGDPKPWHGERKNLNEPDYWIPFLARYKRAFIERAAEAEQISRMIQRETLPVIVCGDFNSTQHNYAFQQIVSSIGLKDAFRSAGKGWGATYHTRLPFARIDFVLVSSEWEVLSAAVPDFRLSDHRPLYVTLDWKK